MNDIERRFAHIPQADRDAAVTAVVARDPHYRGVDFRTMMELVLDADAHLPIIGDVPVEGAAATELVRKLAGFTTADDGTTDGPA